MGCGASTEAPPKKGFVFRARLIGGLNLYNNAFGAQIPGTKTSAMNFQGKSDPYVKFSCHGVNKQSRTILHEQNPVWNEDFYFNVDTSEPTLKLQVFDADALSRDDCIGTAEIPLHGLVQKGKVTEVWVPLNGAKANGEIGLSFVECYRTHLTLKDGRDVEPMDSLSGSSDCYATVQIGQQDRQQSTTKGWTLNPIWNEKFTFYVPYGIESQLEIILWDHDSVGVNSNMGWFYQKLDGIPLQAPKDYESKITNAKGLLSFTLEDDTVVEIAAAGPVTEAHTSKFPPSAPQTANFSCKVVGAYNLAAADHSYLQDFIDGAKAEVFHEFTENKGNSDPFVRLSCEGQVYDTFHINNTLEPIWNQQFRFIARNKEESELNLEVFDHDIVSNDAIGRVKLPLTAMKPGESTEMWSFLDAGRGEVGVELKMNFQLKVRVVSCTDLPAKDMNGMCDPYVKLTLGSNSPYTTRICRDNRSPWIDEDFRWSVPTLKDLKLHIEVWDSDLMIFKKGLSEDLLGMVDVPLDNFEHGIPNEMELPLKISGQDTGKIRLIITDEIPLPPSALAEIAEKGEAAMKAAVAKANEAKAFITNIRDPNPETKDEGEFEVADPKIDKRPRYTRISADVVGVRGLKGAAGAIYVGVSVPLQGQRYKTKEKTDVVNADFNETFSFNVPTKTISGIELTVFQSSLHDYTGGWNADHIAQGYLSFTKFNDNQGLIRGSDVNDTWIPLKKNEEVIGEICIRVREQYRYNVRIMDCKGLNTKADPYVICKFDQCPDQTHRTNAVSKDPSKDRTDGIPGNPIWDEQYTYFTDNKGIFSFKVMDEECITEDKALDTCTFDASELRRGVPLIKTITMPTTGAELTFYIKEEEKMGLLDQLVDAAANAAKLAAKAAAEAAEKAGAAVAEGVSAVTGALGGLFGK